MKKYIEVLNHLSACESAVTWLSEQQSIKQAWNECKQGDWLLWLVGKLNIDRKRLVSVACDCAELSIHLVPEDEPRPSRAIEVARLWAQGEATLDDVRIAAAAAYTAADNADTYDAANAADAAANAAATAAYANAAAYAAVYAADAAGIRKETLIKCATITRKYFNLSEILEKM